MADVARDGKSMEDLQENAYHGVCEQGSDALHKVSIHVAGYMGRLCVDEDDGQISGAKCGAQGYLDTKHSPLQTRHHWVCG